MNAYEAHQERLIEIAAKAHCRSVTLDLARAVHSIHSLDKPTLGKARDIASAQADCVAADKALADWRCPDARRARGQ
jgi:hypothetical protein